MRNNLWIGSGISGMGEIPMLGNPVKGLTALIRKIFLSGEQGFAYDPNDLTEEKIKWRRNLLTETEFRNGVADTLLRGGDITQASFAGLMLNTGLSLKRSGVVGYAYKAASSTVNVTHVFSCFVRMPNGRAPIVGINTDVNVDLSIVLNGAVLSTTKVIDMGGGLYRVYGTRLATIEGATVGVAKYGSQSTDDVLVSGFQYERGETPSPYQPFTDFNTEFLRQFPSHALYQDASGTIPVAAQGQPVGLMLDKSKGFVLGDEAVVGGNFESGLIGTLAKNALSAGTLTLNTVSPISGTQDARVTVTAVDGLSPQLSFNRNVPRIVGALYEFSFDYKVLSGSPFIAQVYNGAGTSGVATRLGGSGKFATRYRAVGLGPGVDMLYFSSSTFDMQIDNVSVKEIKGNHAYQTVSASRPILQQTPILGNELVANGGFSNGTAYPFDNFTASNGGFSAKTTTSKIGGAVSNTVLNVTAGLTYVIAFDLISSLDGRPLSVRLVSDKSGAGSGGNPGLNTSKLGKNIINYTPSVSGPFYLQFNNGGAAICDYRVENISMKEVTGYRTDQNYLAFDGVDDFLQTNNIDFTATDNLSCFAGVNLATNATAILFETSANSTSNVGSFGLYLAHIASDARMQDFKARSRFIKTANGTVTTGKYVFSSKQTATTQVIRLNAAELSDAQANAGNYGNYPLYIGRRAGTSLPFNGHLYGLLGIGRLTSDSETIALEKTIAKNTGVALNV